MTIASEMILAMLVSLVLVAIFWQSTKRGMSSPPMRWGRCLRVEVFPVRRRP